MPAHPGGRFAPDPCSQRRVECERLLRTSERLNSILAHDAADGGGDDGAPFGGTGGDCDGGDVAPTSASLASAHGAGAEDEEQEARAMLRRALLENQGSSESGGRFDAAAAEATLDRYLSTVRSFLEELRGMAQLQRFRGRVDAADLKRMGFRLAAVRAGVRARQTATVAADDAHATARQAHAQARDSGGGELGSGGVGRRRGSSGGASSGSLSVGRANGHDGDAHNGSGGGNSDHVDGSEGGATSGGGGDHNNDDDRLFAARAARRRVGESPQQARAALASGGGTVGTSNSRSSRDKSALRADMEARRAQAEEDMLGLATAMRQRLVGVNGQIRGDLDALDGIDGQIDANADFLDRQQRKIDERLANQLGICKVIKWVVICTVLFVLTMIFIFIT